MNYLQSSDITKTSVPYYNFFNDICLISTNANKYLANEISQLLHINLLNCKMEYFANGEFRPVILESVRGKDVFIITTGISNNVKSINDYIMETYLTIRSCKWSDARSITLICPNYFYARQEKKDNSRGCISGKAIADLIELSGIKRMICFDLHAPAIQGFFSIPVDNLYTIHIFCEYITSELYKLYNKDNLVLVAPDYGAWKRIEIYATKLGLDYVVINKKRNNKIKNEVEESNIKGGKKLLNQKYAIIIDDMCDTGGTIQKASQLLIDNGAKGIFIMVTHAILSNPGCQRINETESIIQLITTDSIDQTEHLLHCNKIKVLSIAPLLSEVIKRLTIGGSISELF